MLDYALPKWVGLKDNGSVSERTQSAHRAQKEKENDNFHFKGLPVRPLTLTEYI